MSEVSAVQRRTIAVLSAGQVLGGISFGATVSLGAVLAAQISGDDALSGLATAAITLGLRLGYPFEALKTGVEAFSGTRRRMERKGAAGGVEVTNRATGERSTQPVEDVEALIRGV